MTLKFFGNETIADVEANHSTTLRWDINLWRWLTGTLSMSSYMTRRIQDVEGKKQTNKKECLHKNSPHDCNEFQEISLKRHIRVLAQ